jgi:hypothetical protein
VVPMCAPYRPLPLPQGDRRCETAAAALVVAPDSGYLSSKTRAEAITCAFALQIPRVGLQGVVQGLTASTFSISVPPHHQRRFPRY